MHLKGMKAVVCGAGGFIGGHLVNSLQSNGVNVIRGRRHQAARRVVPGLRKTSRTSSSI